MKHSEFLDVRGVTAALSIRAESYFNGVLVVVLASIIVGGSESNGSGTQLASVNAAFSWKDSAHTYLSQN